MSEILLRKLEAIRHELALLDPEGGADACCMDPEAAADDILHRLRHYAETRPDVSESAAGNADERLLAVTDSLMAMASLDFSHTVPLDGSGDVVDAVATGVNMLAEELEHSVVSRDAVDRERKRYRDLFEQSAEALMMIAPPSWNFTAVNTMALRMFGMESEAAFLEMGAWDVSPDRQPDGTPSAEKAKVMIQRAVEEGSAYFDWTHCRVDGTEFPATVLLACMEVDGEQVVLATVRDVTEKVRAQNALRNSEAKFKALYDNMSSGVAVYRVENKGRDFIFTDLNRAAERIDDVVREDVLGRNVVQVFPGIRGTGLLDAFRRVWRTGTPEQVPAVMYRDDRIAGWRDNYVYRLPSGEVVAVYDDITEQKRAEEAVRQTAREWEATFEAASDMIAIQNADHTLVRVNRAYADMFGKQPDELRGRKCHDVVHGTDAPLKNCPCGTAIRSGKPAVAEIYDPGLDRYLDVSVSPMFDDNGRLTGLVHISKDITERKQAEEAVRRSEERLRDLFENAGDLIQSIRPDGSFLYVNAAWLKALGYAREELDSMTIFDVLDDDCRQKCTETFGSVMNGEEIGTVEACFRAKDGRKLMVEGNVSCRRDGTGKAVSTRAIFRDITDRKAAEEKLARTMDELERSNRELTDFAHIASHDLQEPLRKVRTFGDRLASRAGDALDERGRDYLGRMQNAAERMSGLLDGLLGYARVTTKANPFEAVDMDEVTAGVLGDLEVRVSETGGSVTKNDLGTVTADPLQMRQLIQNLVGNALKYHRPDVPPEVRITARRTDDGTWYELTVADNGIGIADEDRDRAFGIFQRLVGKNEYEGTGVGLAICKKIVERHGGTISLKGEPGAGTTFTVRLPLGRKEIRVSDGKAG